MYQSHDPFSVQFGPMTPTGSVTSQLEETAPPSPTPRPPHGDTAPPLPPRPSCPRPRPVPDHNAPRAAPSPSTGSPTQVPQFVQLGASLPNSFDPPPAYSSRPPDPRAATPNIPPSLPARANPSLGSPEPARRHPIFGSTFGQLATAVFPESITPGLSSVLAFDNNPAVQNPPTQLAPPPGIQSSQVVVNGVALGQADVLALQAVLGPVFPGSYWSVIMTVPPFLVLSRPFLRPETKSGVVNQVRPHEWSIRYGRRALQRFPCGEPAARGRAACSRRLGPYRHRSLHQRPRDTQHGCRGASEHGGGCGAGPLVARCSEELWRRRKPCCSW